MKNNKFRDEKIHPLEQYFIFLEWMNIKFGTQVSGNGILRTLTEWYVQLDMFQLVDVG